MTDEIRETIREARTAADFQAFGALIEEYVAWSRDRYRDVPWFVERVFGHQNLAAEIAALPVSYGPSKGKTLVAEREGEVCGAVAYRRLDAGVCEMKRLFVSSRFKTHGTGRRLCAALISAARADGFHLMRLDTGHLLTEAIGLYESMGFSRCAAYHDYPAELRPFMVFMELPLDAA